MRRVILAGILVFVAVCVDTVGAQEASVEVRTWTGQSWRLGSPTLEVFYTIVPPSSREAAPLLGPGTLADLAVVTTTGGVGANPGSVSARIEGPQRPLLPAGPDAKQGRRQQDVLTLTKDEVETRVPLANVAEVTFTRQPVKSTLMPHAAADHFRYAATVRLLDGSSVVADYVNLGTSVLRGTTPQGTVDVPWQQIELLRFER